ncbi:hypothetical protein [Clostridium sp.]|uniref:hypothetical protein n=1 Tax=Clostridium sp. TaxID=1506 RepID=UPI002FC5E757
MEVNRETIRKYDVQIAAMASYIEMLNDNRHKGELSFEENVLLNRLHKVKDEMEKYLDRVKYFDGHVYEGTLKMDDHGKFYLDYIDEDGLSSRKTYSCGSRIEIYLYDDYEESWDWSLGRVESGSEMNEHGHKYIYYGSNKPYLEEGMKVRYRE